MDDVTWRDLIARFPEVPARLRMEVVDARTPAGTPIVAHERPVIALAFSPDSRTAEHRLGPLTKSPPDLGPRVPNCLRELGRVAVAKQARRGVWARTQTLSVWLRVFPAFALSPGSVN